MHTSRVLYSTNVNVSISPQTFEIEKGSARRTVSRMIFNKEISGAWEHEPSETLVLHKVGDLRTAVLTDYTLYFPAQYIDPSQLNSIDSLRRLIRLLFRSSPSKWLRRSPCW